MRTILRASLSVGIAVLALTLLLLPGSAVEIVDHRGASHDAPENTLAAFRLGWEQQANADELDIQLTQRWRHRRDA